MAQPEPLTGEHLGPVDAARLAVVVLGRVDLDRPVAVRQAEVAAHKTPALGDGDVGRRHSQRPAVLILKDLDLVTALEVLRDAELHTLPGLTDEAVGHALRESYIHAGRSEHQYLCQVHRVDEELLPEAPILVVALHGLHGLQGLHRIFGSRCEAVGGRQERDEERCGVHHAEWFLQAARSCGVRATCDGAASVRSSVSRAWMRAGRLCAHAGGEAARARGGDRCTNRGTAATQPAKLENRVSSRLEHPATGWEVLMGCRVIAADALMKIVLQPIKT